MPATRPDKPEYRIGRGRTGEDRACAWLSARGWKILQRNFRKAIGEVDIIARDGDILGFIEVKNWQPRFWPALGRALGPDKRMRMRRLAGIWLADHPECQVAELRFYLFLIQPDQDQLLPMDID